MAEIFSLRGIKKTYKNGVKALADVSLQMDEGETVALLGPNGAGKTTLIKILTGLLFPDEGKVWIKGVQLSRGDSFTQSFGIVLQEIGLWPHLTVTETLHFVGKLYKMKSNVIHERTAELLQALALKEHEKLRFGELSEGLKRRLNLASALIHEPEVLILDEPSLGLDVHARVALWEYLLALKKKPKKLSILLSTHDMEEADRLSDRVGVLDHGKLLALDSVSNLKSVHASGDQIEMKLGGNGAISPDFFSHWPGFVSAKATNGTTRLFIRNGIRELPSIMRAMFEAGVSVEDLAVKPATLAEVFLALTGRSLIS